MRNVTFKKAGMSNFCCHIDPMEIVFENGKLTMITGPNGIGKTAIFQAIPYALYGSCEKGKGDDVVNDIIRTVRVVLVRIKGSEVFPAPVIPA